MTHGLKEFIASSEAAAVAMAEQHYGVSGGELETCVVPEDLEVAGLVGRTLLLAAVKGARAAEEGAGFVHRRDAVGPIPLRCARAPTRSGSRDR